MKPHHLLTLGILSSVAPVWAADSAPSLSLWRFEEPHYKPAEANPFGLNIEYGQTIASGKPAYMKRDQLLAAKYDNGIDEVSLIGDSSYLKTGQALVDDRRHTYIGYDRYLGARISLFVLNDWEQNRPASINYVQLTGAGIKYELVSNEEGKLNVGLAYLKRAKQTEFTPTTPDASGGFASIRTTRDDRVLSARLKAGYTHEKTRFQLVAFYQPALEKQLDPVTGEKKKDYSLSADAAVAYFVASKTYLSLAYLYRYDSILAAPDAPHAADKTTFKIGFEF